VCRLIGFAAPTPTTLLKLVGDDELIQLESLSCLHGDGWGTSWHDPDTGEPRRYRSIAAAADDPQFAVETRDMASAARIVHLRWATEGYAVHPGNSHPFQADGISFAHNGRISPVGRLDALLAPQTRRALADATDSERYFALVRQELAAEPGDLSGAVLRATGRLRAHYAHSSLNALLLTATELIVVHGSEESVSPLADLAAHPAGDQEDHMDAYFSMRRRRTDDGTLLFTSSGLDTTGWEPLPAESVTTVDLATLRTTTRDIPTDQDARMAPR
jgi:glutamine amidotransferase